MLLVKARYILLVSWVVSARQHLLDKFVGTFIRS